jgi:tetratricopeptide (TPR) repeat protein
MGQKLYDSAIEQYTQAIEVDANPVYFSNRAAAWGALGEHEKAVEDATRAIELDPKFAKGFSRLGWVWRDVESHTLHLLDTSCSSCSASSGLAPSLSGR